MTHDKLDNLLKQWASRHVLDEAHSRRLVSQITEELARPADVAAELSADRRSWIPLPRRLAYAALAAAATLFLVVITSSFLLRWQPMGNNEEVGLSPVAPIGQPEIEAGARLFCGVERLFGDQLRWVADNQNEVRLDVRRTAGRTIAEATPLLIRVVVLQKRSQERSSWAKVLETNVLARSEELVELVSNQGMASRLTLWGYPLPDGKIALDASIRLSAPIRAGIDVTNVLDPSKPKKILSLKVGDTEYRVYEMVTPLPRREDASCSKT
jgi:hypothetical protein